MNSTPSFPQFQLFDDEDLTSCELFYFQANSIVSMITGLKETLKDNHKKIKEAKQQIAKKTLKRSLLEEKLDNALNELIKIKNSILSSCDELELEDAKLTHLEKIIDTTSQSINILESNDYLIKILTRRELLRSVSTNTTSSKSSKSIRRTQSNSKTIEISNSKNNLTLSTNSSTKSLLTSKETDYFSLISKPFMHILTFLQNTCNIDNIVNELSNISNTIFKVEEKLTNKLSKICESFKTEETKILEQHINSKNVLDSLIICNNNISQFSKDLKDNKVFKEICNTKLTLKFQKTIKLEPNIIEILSNFASNLKLLAKQDHEPMIINTRKLIKSTAFEVSELLRKTKELTIKPPLRTTNKLGKAPDLSKSDPINLYELMDLVLETQISLGNSASMFISNTFLGTFYYFISTKDLIKYLLCRYCSTYTVDFNIDKKALHFAELSQYQVLSFIRQLINRYSIYLALNKNDSDQLEIFIKDIIPLWHPYIAKQLLKKLKKEQKRFQTNITKQIEYIKSISIKTETLSEFDISSYPPRTFANQLTKFEFNLFSHIRISEFAQQNWIKNKKVATGLVHNSVHFNSIVNYIIKRILNEESCIERGKLLRYFVISAMYLYKLNNFNGLFEVMSALNSVSIYRLNLSWKEAGEDIILIFNQLSTLLAKNFEIYREELNYIQPPVTPYLGIYLTDLTFLEDGNPTFINDKVNFFFKFGKISEIFTKVKLFQNTKYESFIDNDNSWIEFFRSLLHIKPLDEDTSFDISIKYESNQETNANPLPIIDDNSTMNSNTLNTLRFHPLLELETPDIHKKKIRRRTMFKNLTKLDNAEILRRSPSRSPTFTTEQIKVRMKHPSTGVKLEKKLINNETHSVFSGETLVLWLMKLLFLSKRSLAIEIGQQLLDKNYIIKLNDTKTGFIDDIDIFYSYPKDDAKQELFACARPRLHTTYTDSDSSEIISSPKSKGILSEIQDKNSLTYLVSIVNRMKHPQSGIKLKTKKSSFLSNKMRDCFKGEDCITWLIQNISCKNRDEAKEIGNNLINVGLIVSLNGNEFKLFKDKSSYYYFSD